MNFLYGLSVRIFFAGISIVSFFGHRKARLWINGRKNSFRNIQNTLNSKPKTPNSKRIWFHCASLGEFEQGRPLMERIRNEKPGTQIVLTFFSPSGYEIRKNFAGADHVFYLPLDTKSNAEQFIALIQPSVAVFVKYEFWFNYLAELKKNNIPTYLVSGIFRKQQYFFHWYGTWAAKNLKNFSQIFLQDDSSKSLLDTIGIHSTVAGDTRFDRVHDISKTAREIPLVKTFCEENNVLIAGSTWPEDEKIIAECVFQDTRSRLIIVPHEIEEENISSVETLFESFKTKRFSAADEKNIQDSRALIIDNIGMLSSLYKYGKVAYIGGGFGSGIHNILEAAVYGLPVIFGPNYQRFLEANELLACGGAFSVRSAGELKLILEKLFSNKTFYEATSDICRNYVEKKRGAVEIIMRSIQKSI